MGMVVLPIFYKVDPSDIRIQRNIARAFVKQEIRFKKNLKKVQRWKDALKEVANISGWHLQNRIVGLVHEEKLSRGQERRQVHALIGFKQESNCADEVENWRRNWLGSYTLLKWLLKFQLIH